ncbi:hypothetical protein [Wolbachia endosymbiont (group A) of Barypeithes pellucidus]|uniref:hypothetical protein n=1 Tax=Wolbachia endosymbiont (group A) of Barypeithes pellucidus TaxID=3139322 RepID=UPI003CCA854D
MSGQRLYDVIPVPPFFVIRVAPIMSSQCLTLGSRKKNDVIQVADTGSFMMMSSQCPDTGIQEFY